MRGWLLVPVTLVAVLLVALPVAALTDTRVEGDFREALGLDSEDCAPPTNLASPWTAGPPLAGVRDEPRAAVIGDMAYLVGGVTALTRSADGRLLVTPSDSVTRFDPRTGAYTELAPLPRPLNHVGVVAHDGQLYVLGGYGRRVDAETSRALYRYDPAGDRWTRLPDLPTPLAAMAAGVIGDRLIVAGGAHDQAPLDETYAFDFERQRWSRLADMHSRREHVGEAVLGGRLYVFGGRAPGSLAVDTAERYDPASDRWERLPAMPVPSGGLAAVAAEGEAIAIGGGDDGAGTVTGAVQAFDPRSGQWRRLPDLRTARHGHGAALLGDEIWVFGGSDCPYFNATELVESLRLPAAAS
jgi:N-acetylneuraminic acid mutarotase